MENYDYVIVGPNSNDSCSCSRYDFRKRI